MDSQICEDGCAIAEARGAQYACQGRCAYKDAALAPAPAVASATEATQEQCSYCKEWYPKPVSLHHDTAECDANIAQYAHRNCPDENGGCYKVDEPNCPALNTCPVYKSICKGTHCNPPAVCQALIVGSAPACTRPEEKTP